MNPMGWRVSLAALVVSLVGVEGRPADLAGLTRIGSVIVTAASETVPESELREIVERRLERAGLVVDGTPGSDLLVTVTAERNRSENGLCAFGTFRVGLTLREAVTVERAPGLTVSAVTWSTSGRIGRFSTKEPPQAIKDTLENQVSAFLQQVASSAQEKGGEGAP